MELGKGIERGKMNQKSASMSLANRTKQAVNLKIFAQAGQPMRIDIAHLQQFRMKATQPREEKLRN